MSVTRTIHTVLVKVTSHNSGGRGSIEYGHPALTDEKVFTDIALRSPIFKSHPIGTLLVVSLKLSGNRRITRNVNHDDNIQTVNDFIDAYGDKLADELRRYNRAHGITETTRTVEPTVVTPVTPVTESEDKNRIWISDEDNKLFDAVRALSDKRHVAIMMIGGSGYGKSSVPEQKSKDWGMNFLRWDCATVRDPEEFFGFRGAVDASTMTDDGEVLFSESEFTRVVERGNAVVVLDELNRIDPYISNVLFPLLDHAGKTSVAGHEIKVGKNVIFVATINLGFQFTGTFQLDTALTNRFIAKVVVDALPKNIERKVLMNRTGVDLRVADDIVNLMTRLRELNKVGKLNLDASTRVSLAMAEIMTVGLDFVTAVNYVIASGTEPDEKKEIMDAVNMTV